MKGRIVIALLLLVVLAVPFLIDDDSDAIINHNPITGDYEIIGDVTLSNDVTFPDGSTVLILPGSSIYIGNYNLIFGQDNRIVIAGSTQMSSTGGSVKVGSGSNVLADSIILTSTQTDLLFTFDGTVSISTTLTSITSVTTTVDSNLKGPMNIRWDDTSMDVNDPRITHKASLSQGEIILGFSSAHIVQNNYEDGTLVSEVTTDIVSSNKFNTLDVTYSISNGKTDYIQIKNMRIESIKVATHYAMNDVSSILTIDGIHDIKSSLSYDNIITLSVSASSVVLEGYEGEILQEKTAFTNVGLDSKLDVKLISEFIIGLIKGSEKVDLTEMLRYLSLTSDSAIIEDYKKETKDELTDLSAVIDASVSSYMTVKWTKDGVDSVITATKMKINSMGMDSNYVMDLDVSISKLTLESKRADSRVRYIEMDGVEFNVNDLAIGNLITTISISGSISLQELIDNCLKYYLFAASVGADLDGDGQNDITAEQTSIVTTKDGMGKTNLNLTVDEIQASLVIEEKPLDLSLKQSTIFISTTMSISELIDYIEDSTDTIVNTDSEDKDETSMMLSLGDFDIEAATDSGFLSVDGEDTTIQADNIDVIALIAMYKSGTISVLDVIDCCESIDLSSSRIKVSIENGLMAESYALKVLKDGSAKNVISVGFDDLTADIPTEKDRIQTIMKMVDLTLSSDGKLSDIVKMLTNKKIDKECHVSLSMSSNGIIFNISNDEHQIGLDISKISPKSPALIDIRASLDNSVFRDTTTMDLSMYSEGYTVGLEMTSVDKSPISAKLSNASANINKLNVGGLYEAYMVSKGLTFEQILDYSDQMKVVATDLSMILKSDGTVNITAYEPSAFFSKNSRNQNVMEVGFDVLTYAGTVDGKDIEAAVKATEINIASYGSLTECIDAMFYGVNFSESTHAEMHIYNAGFTVIIKDDDSTDSITVSRISEESPKYMSIVLLLDYAKYRDDTTIKASITAIGYSLIFTSEYKVTDPDGVGDLRLELIEVSGDLEFVFGDTIAISSSLFMDWKLDFHIYDIAILADGDDSTFTSSRGELNISGYDRKTDGILASIDKFSKNDYTLSTRLKLDATHMYVYGDERSYIMNEYDDPRVYIGILSIDMKRDDRLNVSVDDVELRVINQDGEGLNKDLGHMNFTKDLSGAAEGKTWIEENAKILTVIGIAIIAGLIILLIWAFNFRPDLVRHHEPDE